MKELNYSYVLTINNPSEREKNVLKCLGIEGKENDTYIRYVKYALECGEGETPHMQIYLHLHKQERFSWIQKRLPRAAIFAAIGTVEQCIDYIGNPDFVYSQNRKDDKAGKRKGGTSEAPVEWGSIEGIILNKNANRKPRVTDELMSIKAAIDDGQNIGDLWQNFFPVMVRYGHRINEYYTHKGEESEIERLTAKCDALRIERNMIENEFNELKREFLSLFTNPSLIDDTICQATPQ